MSLWDGPEVPSLLASSYTTPLHGRSTTYIGPPRPPCEIYSFSQEISPLPLPPVPVSVSQSRARTEIYSEISVRVLSLS